MPEQPEASEEYPGSLEWVWGGNLHAAYHELSRSVIEFIVDIRRTRFATKLSHWMPECIAQFLAGHWPQYLLPGLDCFILKDLDESYNPPTD